ncbi:MAG TPA: hypothetical protein VFY49_18350 [Myxococcota bacterium]|nr:hypothetical protein [Myxococcota bacterium]
MNAEPAREGIRSVAIEAALADLERALVRDRCHVVVSASTGTAKRLLLSALAERVAGALRVIPLPAAEDGLELCAHILQELGEPCGDDAEYALIEVIRRLAGQRSALALVAGDARALSEPVLRQLGRLAAQTRPGLRLVLVSDGTGRSDRDAIAEFMAPLGIGAVKVVLDTPLHREPAARGVVPASPAPPRLPANGAAAHTSEMRTRRRAAPRAPGMRMTRAPAMRAARFALVGVAAAAVGFAAVNRVEIPRALSAPQRAEIAPVAAPAPAAPAALPHAEVPAKPAPPRRAPPKARPVVDAVVDAVPAPESAPVPAPVEIAALEPLPAPDALVETPPPPAEIAPEQSPEPEPEHGRTIAISLNALPWAHIEIDGLDVGVTPMADVKLSEGPHRFRARFPDGRVIERTVRVDAVRDHITFP